MNQLLKDMLDRFGFVKSKRSNIWVRQVDNESKCQFNIYVRLLDDSETIRVSISERDAEEIEAIDLFESKRYLSLINLLNVIG